MINYAEEKYVPVLTAMWKLCFPDTEEFVRFYFECIYRKEETIVYVENNIPVAALQMIPYSLKIGTKEVNASYISGAMTHPEYRKKGYMNELLLFAFEEMKKKGIAFSFLIPQEEWLFGFYAKFGYEKAFPKTLKEISFLQINNTEIDPLINIYDNYSSIDTESLYTTYDSFLHRKENVVLKTKQQLEIILKDLFLENGKIFSFEDKGIAFVFKQPNGVVVIKEMFYTSEEIKTALFSSIRKSFRTDTAVLLHDTDAKEARQNGMIKTINCDIPIPSDMYMSMMLD